MKLLFDKQKRSKVTILISFFLNTHYSTSSIKIFITVGQLSCPSAEFASSSQVVPTNRYPCIVYPHVPPLAHPGKRYLRRKEFWRHRFFLLFISLLSSAKRCLWIVIMFARSSLSPNWYGRLSQGLMNSVLGSCTYLIVMVLPLCILLLVWAFACLLFANFFPHS